MNINYKFMIIILIIFIFFIQKKYLERFSKKKCKVDKKCTGFKSKVDKKKRIIAKYKGKKIDLTGWNRIHKGGSILHHVKGKDVEKYWTDDNIKNKLFTTEYLKKIHYNSETGKLKDCVKKAIDCARKEYKR